MVNEAGFMDRIGRLVSKGRDSVLTLEDIKNNFGDMDLDESQMEQIILYLGKAGVQVTGKDHTDEIVIESEYDLDDLNLPANVKSDDAMKIYVSQLEETEPLGREEEDGLASEAASGDSAAFGELINADMRLVFAIVKKYYEEKKSSGRNFYDLVQEGNIGLLNAAAKYDPARGMPFRRYASYWIRQAVLKAEAEDEEDKDFSDDMALTLNRIKDVMEKLSSDGGPVPSAQEAADYLDMPVEKVRQAVDFSNGDIVLRDEPGEKYDHELTPDQLRNIENVFDELRPLEKSILKMRFGIGGHKVHSSEDTSRMFGVSEGYIRQVEARALMLSRMRKRKGNGAV